MIHPLHNPARAKGESVADYKARRHQSAAVIAGNRRGTMTHVATEPVQLPVAGVDSRVDEAVRRGLYKDLRVVTLKTGEQIRIGRTKGETFRHPVPREIARRETLENRRAAKC